EHHGLELLTPQLGVEVPSHRRWRPAAIEYDDIDGTEVSFELLQQAGDAVLIAQVDLKTRGRLARRRQCSGRFIEHMFIARRDGDDYALRGQGLGNAAPQ